MVLEHVPLSPIQAPVNLVPSVSSSALAMLSVLHDYIADVDRQDRERREAERQRALERERDERLRLLSERARIALLFGLGHT